MFKTGDFIVYLQTKHSTHPSLKAVEIRPTPNGELYSYEVQKYWVVANVQPNGHVIALTRRGKRREIAVDDPCLRKAHWWERLFFGHRFPQWPSREIVEPASVEPKRRANFAS